MWKVEKSMALVTDFPTLFKDKDLLVALPALREGQEGQSSPPFYLQDLYSGKTIPPDSLYVELPRPHLRRDLGVVSLIDSVAGILALHLLHRARELCQSPQEQNNHLSRIHIVAPEMLRSQACEDVLGGIHSLETLLQTMSHGSPEIYVIVRITPSSTNRQPRAHADPSEDISSPRGSCWTFSAPPITQTQQLAPFVKSFRRWDSCARAIPPGRWNIRLEGTKPN